MSRTVVVNLHRSKFDVYIGRPGKGLDGPWGNPYEIGKDGTREECIEQYRRYLLNSPELLRRLPELCGKTLGCFCAPLPCHGDVLAELANKLMHEGQGNLFGGNE